MSYVIGYTENRGSYGDAIVVDIEPILVDGYRRTKVNVTNLQCIIDNNLKIGSPQKSCLIPFFLILLVYTFSKYYFIFSKHFILLFFDFIYLF